jgi:hypothetical protein
MTEDSGGCGVMMGYCLWILLVFDLFGERILLVFILFV